MGLSEPAETELLDDELWDQPRRLTAHDYRAETGVDRRRLRLDDQMEDDR